MHIDQQPSMTAPHLDTLVINSASTSVRNDMQEKWGEMVEIEVGIHLNSITMRMDVLPLNAERVISEIYNMAA
jgi:hypothetical protein